jgi:6-phosphogluconolactonase
VDEPVIRETFVFPDCEAASRALASTVAGLLGSALEEAPRASIAVSGGKTPGPLFTLLGSEFRTRVDWSRVHVFWTDERAVPVTDPGSNFRLANERWLVPARVPPENLHPIPCGTAPVDEAARRYESELRRFFGGGDRRATPEGFDVTLLGVGLDGHVASIFPPAPASSDSGAWVTWTETAPQPPHVARVSVALDFLNRSRDVLFLVCGREKHAILRDVLDPVAGRGEGLPAARVVARDRLEWFLDAAAASDAGPG